MSSRLQQQQHQNGSKSKQPKKLSDDKLKILQENKRVFMHVFGNAELLYKYLKRTTILRWSKAIVSNKFRQSRAGYRIKGRILIACTKCEPNLSLKQALVRWKVRSDPEIIKNAINRFALYSKINDFTALARLKNLVPPERQQDRIRKRNNKRKAGIFFGLMTQRLILNAKRLPWDGFKDVTRRPSGQSLGMILSVIHSKEMKKILHKRFKLWLLKAKLETARLRTVRKQLIRLFRVYEQQAFNAEQASIFKVQLKKNYENCSGYESLERSQLQEQDQEEVLLGAIKNNLWSYQQGVYQVDQLTILKRTQKKKNWQLENKNYYQGVFLLSSMRKMARRTHQMSFQVLKNLNEKANVKKNQIIQALLKNSFNKSYQAFYNWANYNTFYKMTRKILTSSDAIQALKQLKTKQNQWRLKQVLERFYNNQTTHSIQKRFIQRLLNTTLGQGLQTFQKWKNLPDPARARLKQHSLQMVSKFQLFLKHKLRGVLNSFNDIHTEAEQKKKLCIKNLIWRATGKQHRMFQEWKKAAQKYKSTITYQKTFKFFETLNKEIKGGMGLILQKDNKLVLNVFKKMLNSYYNRLKFMFNQWRNNAHVLTIRQQITNQQISLLLTGLSRFNKQNKQHLLREVLHKFDRFRGLARVIQQVNLKMMKTVQGQYLRSFQEWKRIPESKEKYGRVSVFSHRLMKFTRKYVKRRSWNDLTDLKYEADKKMKKVVNLLMWITSSDVSKAFHQWAIQTQRNKVIEHFTEKNDRLREELVRQKLIGWFSSSKNLKREQLRSVLNKFILNTNENEKIRRFHSRLLQTISGQVLVSFKMWRALPQPMDQEKVAKASKFENKLQNLTKTFLMKSFTALYDQYLDGVARQKRAVLLLFKSQESNISKALHLWQHQVQLIRDTLRCKQLGQFLESLTRIVSTNGLPVFENQTTTQKKLKVVERIQANQKMNLKHAFAHWKRYEQVMAVKEDLNENLNSEKQRLLLEALDQFSNLNKHALMRQILEKFHQNWKIKQIQSNFFNKVLGTTAGQVMVSFNKWHGLPVPKNFELIHKANKYEKQLFKLVSRGAKGSFDAMKDLNAQALDAKSYCIQKMVLLTQSSNKRLFAIWKTQAMNLKSFECCRRTTILFTHLQSKIKGNLQVILTNKRDEELKHRAIMKMFGHFGNRQHQMFLQWVQFNRVERIANYMNQERTTFLIDNLNKYISQSKTMRLRTALASFQKNSKISIRIKQLNFRLLKTVNGMCMDSFQKWHNLPELKNYAPATQFIKQLQVFSRRIVKRTSLDHFQQLVYEGRNTMKRAANMILINTLDNYKKAFLLLQANVINTRLLQTNIQSVDDITRMKIVSWLNAGNKLRNNQLTEVLSKFAENSKRAGWKQRIFFKLRHTTYGGVLDVFQKWKSLPKKKDYEKIQRAGEFEKKMLRLCQKQLSWAYEPLVDIHEDALSKKKTSVLLLFKRQESTTKRSLHLWKSQVDMIREALRCKNLVGLFENLNQTVKVLFTPFMENTQQYALKMKTSEKLFANLLMNVHHAFTFWRNLTNTLKVKEQLENTIDENNRKNLIEALQKYSYHNKHQDLRNVLHKFATYKNIQNVRKRFFTKVFSTTSGQVINVFSTWRNLPVPKDYEQMRKANEFEKKIFALFSKNLKSSFDPLKDLYLEGQNKQRQAMRQLIQITATSQKRMFSNWVNYNRTVKSVLICKFTTRMFQSLQNQVQEDVKIILTTQRDEEIKKRVLQQIFQLQDGLKRQSFQKWNNNTKIAGIAQQMSEEKTNFVINNLQKYLKFSQREQLLHVLDKFKANHRRVKQIQSFNARLLQTIGGQYFDSFYKWRHLPDIKTDYAKASKFETQLLKATLRIIKRNSWDPMRDLQYEGEAKQKRAVNILLMTTMSDFKRYFVKWHNYCVNQRVVDHFTQENLRLCDEITRTKILAWLERNDIYKQRQLALVLKKFNQNATRGNWVQRIYNKLCQTKQGTVFTSFNIWRSLPVPPNAVMIAKAGQFERRIIKILGQPLRDSFEPFKDINQEGIARKKRAVLLLIKRQEGANKHAFNLWHQQVERIREALRCRYLLNFMQNLDKHICVLAQPFFETQAQSNLKEKTLIRLMSNLNTNLGHGFRTWKDFADKSRVSEQLDSQNKQFVIDALKRASVNNKTSNLRQALWKFEKLRRIKNIQNMFFRKILSTTAGHVVESFKTWKNLPNKPDMNKINAANKFERSITRFFKHIVKKTFDPMRETYAEGLDKQKTCIRKMIYLTQSANRRLFDIWKHQNIQAKQIEACRLTTKTFTNLNAIFIENLKIFMQSQREQQIKYAVIQRIFDQQKHKLRGSFQYLNTFRKIENIRNELDDQTRGIVIENLEKFLKGNKKSGLQKALEGFHKNARQKNIVKQILHKIMLTKVGQCFDTFSSWRNLPDPKKVNQKNSKHIGFHTKLLSVTLRRFKALGYSPLEDLNYDAQAKKKYLVNKLIQMNQSERQKKFLLWHKFSKEQIQQQKAKLVFKLFQAINNNTQYELNPLFMEAHSNRKKIEALKNMIDKWEVQFKDSFSKWKDTKEKLELINEKLLSEQRERRLLDQESTLKKLSQWKLNYVLSKFRRAARDKILIKKFYKVLYTTAAGGVIDSFTRWRALPVPVKQEQIQNANKFEQSLINIFRKSTKKNSWNYFNDLKEQAQNIQNRYGNLIFRTAEGSLRRHFKHWRDTNLITKERERNQKVNALVDILNTKISKNLAIAFVDDQTHKKQMVAQLFNLSKLNQMSMSFMIWHKKCCRYNQKDRIINQFTISSQFMHKQLSRRFAHWRSLVKSQRLINKVLSIQKILKLDLIYTRILKQKALDSWKLPKDLNPWFKRAAMSIIKNSRLNIQLSYWRMKESAFSKKKTNKTLQTIKVKKFMNVFQKCYEKTLTQALIQIDNFSKTEGIPSFQQSRISNIMSTPGKSQIAALFPQQKYTTSVIAFEKLKFVFQKIEHRNLSRFFQQSKKIEMEKQILTMSSEMTSIRGLITELDGEKRSKEEELIVANKTIEHLNKRLTFMITKKFISLLEEVQDSLTYDAFKAIKEIGEFDQ